MRRIIYFLAITFISCRQDVSLPVYYEKTISSELNCNVNVNTIMSLPVSDHYCYLFDLIDEQCFSDQYSDKPNAIRIQITREGIQHEILTISGSDSCWSYVYKIIPFPQFNAHYYIVESKREITYSVFKKQLFIPSIQNYINEIQLEFRSNDTINDYNKLYIIETLENGNYNRIVKQDTLLPKQLSIWNRILDLKNG